MSVIDCITAILSVPGVEEDGKLRDIRPGEPALDEHFARLGQAFETLVRRNSDGNAPIDILLGNVLDQPVKVRSADFTYYEKKGTVYPAIVIATEDLRDADNASLAGVVTEHFRDPGLRSRLAEAFGLALNVEWVSIYTTFGPSG